MHDIKFIEANIESFKDNLNKRNFDTKIVDTVIAENKKRKELTTNVETTQSKIKQLSKEVGMKKKNGEDAAELMNEVATLKASMEEDNNTLGKIKEQLDYNLSTIPNMLADDCPIGSDENDNVEVNKWGDPKSFNFKVKDHADIGEDLGMLDFETGAKLTGARFVVYKDKLARLERAIANYMIDFHLDNGYEEIIPPFIVNSDSLYGTGQLPKFSEDLFKIEGKSWYLIPTSEVPVTNILRGQIVDESELPKSYVSYTPCFRSEAGSHGRDTRGLIRMHQFNKVEMVNITKPEESSQTLARMVKSAETILENLGLPYRTVRLCSGDMGFGSKVTFDLEVWIPSQDTYREISSCSDCWDFQARRASIRFKKQGEKPRFAHTLNGSGLAVGRTLVAILENYQNEDGSVTVPEVLRPYMGGTETIFPKK
ncbi:MAG: serine--tRNA ligase [Bacteriovoracaceae bacterium]|jgi:seryl-tRNA synthetase|nr:serine--tRNA ligase [Bacteriovoracaceae bacterium]